MCVCSFHDAHLGKDSHDNIAGAHATARAICTDLCHHYHQWCLAIELKAPELAGTVQYSAVQNRTTTCDLCFASTHTHTERLFSYSGECLMCIFITLGIDFNLQHFNFIVPLSKADLASVYAEMFVCLQTQMMMASSLPGRGQHHPPECSLVSDETTFEQAGGVLHDARWGGRQHFYEDVHLYLTYCGGAGCSFHSASDNPPPPPPSTSMKYSNTSMAMP